MHFGCVLLHLEISTTHSYSRNLVDCNEWDLVPACEYYRSWEWLYLRVVVVTLGYRASDWSPGSQLGLSLVNGDGVSRHEGYQDAGPVAPVTPESGGGHVMAWHQAWHQSRGQHGNNVTRRVTQRVTWSQPGILISDKVMSINWDEEVTILTLILYWLKVETYEHEAVQAQTPSFNV